MSILLPVEMPKKLLGIGIRSEPTLFAHAQGCGITMPDLSNLSHFPEDKGVVGWCEGAVYLTSLGRPTDIGLQLGKACYPCSG